MMSNEGKESCRTIGLIAERIICLADYYDDALGQCERSIFYDPRYEDKGNIVADMKEAAKEISNAVKHISVGDLTSLYGILGNRNIIYKQLNESEEFIMSYLMIFATKIVNLSDGRVVHFDRSGCNNDDEGRRANDWTAKVYTQQEFKKRIESLKNRVRRAVRDLYRRKSSDSEHGNARTGKYRNDIEYVKIVLGRTL